MSSCNIENGRIVFDESDITDPAERVHIGFLIDLATPLCDKSLPAMPDERGIVDRPIAPDVSPALLQIIANYAVEHGATT